MALPAKAIEANSIVTVPPDDGGKPSSLSLPLTEKSAGVNAIEIDSCCRDAATSAAAKTRRAADSSRASIYEEELTKPAPPPTIAAGNSDPPPSTSTPATGALASKAAAVVAPSSPRPTKTELIKDKLTCNLCFSLMHDPITMTCRVRHSFCSPCYAAMMAHTGEENKVWRKRNLRLWQRGAIWALRSRTLWVNCPYCNESCSGGKRSWRVRWMLRLWELGFGPEKEEEVATPPPPPQEEAQEPPQQERKEGWKLSAVRHERYQREAREIEAGEILWMHNEFDYSRSMEEMRDL